MIEKHCPTVRPIVCLRRVTYSDFYWLKLLGLKVFDCKLTRFIIVGTSHFGVSINMTSYQYPTIPWLTLIAIRSFQLNLLVIVWFVELSKNYSLNWKNVANYKDSL